MSTAQQTPRKQLAEKDATGQLVKTEKVELAIDFLDKPAEYIPLGERLPIKLSVNMVLSRLSNPSKGGRLPQETDALRHCMICSTAQLNPWTGDCHLVGYDCQVNVGNGKKEWQTKWETLVAVKALWKRAECNEQYDGAEHGVVVLKSDGETIEDREGEIVLPKETLLGGWCKVYRKDRNRPETARLMLGTFSKGADLWSDNPMGMICKCAAAAALRRAFPTQVGALYLQDEMDAFHQRNVKVAAAAGDAMHQADTLDQLAKGLRETRDLVAAMKPPHAGVQDADPPATATVEDAGAPGGPNADAVKSTGSPISNLAAQLTACPDEPAVALLVESYTMGPDAVELQGPESQLFDRLVDVRLQELEREAIQAEDSGDETAQAPAVEIEFTPDHTRDDVLTAFKSAPTAERVAAVMTAARKAFSGADLKFIDDAKKIRLQELQKQG